MAKYTPLSVQNELTSKIHGFHDRASATKKAYYEKRQEILRDERLSDAAKTGDLAELATATGAQLKSIRGEQEAYVSNLKSSLERELSANNNRQTDAASIMLRRDASDRARKIETEREALAALRDAVNNGDEGYAHAIGTHGRNNGWPDVADAWNAAYPSTSGVAEALDWVESVTSDGAYNLGNSAAYSNPAE